MQLERHGSRLLVRLDDGSEHVVTGAFIRDHHDCGGANVYGTEEYARWGEAVLLRDAGVLHVCVFDVVEWTGGIGGAFSASWRSDDDGRTWSHDPGRPTVSKSAVVAAVTTHPSFPPTPGLC